jgi:hypothetical protein
MERSLSRKVDIHTDGKQTSYHLYNPKIHYHFRINLPLDPIQRQLNPIQIFTSYILKTNYNAILLCTSRSTKWSLSFRFSDWNLYISLPWVLTAQPISPSRSLPLDEEYKLWNSSSGSFFSLLMLPFSWAHVFSLVPLFCPSTHYTARSSSPCI